jgi:hypothetical protein
VVCYVKCLRAQCMSVKSVLVLVMVFVLMVKTFDIKDAMIKTK